MLNFLFKKKNTEVLSDRKSRELIGPLELSKKNKVDVCQCHTFGTHVSLFEYNVMFFVVNIFLNLC